MTVVNLRVLHSFAFLLLSLLLVLPGCEKKYPEKTTEETKPVEAKPAEIKPVEINLKETKLAAILEDYEAGEIIFSASP